MKFPEGSEITGEICVKQCTLLHLRQKPHSDHAFKMTNGMPRYHLARPRRHTSMMMTATTDSTVSETLTRQGTGSIHLSILPVSMWRSMTSDTAIAQTKPRSTLPHDNTNVSCSHALVALLSQFRPLASSSVFLSHIRSLKPLSAIKVCFVLL